MYINVIGVGFLTGVFAWIMDNVNNLSTTMNLPPQTLMTMAYILLIFDVFAFLYFIANVFHYIIQSSNEAGGVV